MRFTPWAFALLTLITAPLSFAGYGQGNPRLEKLYTTYLAPCCWRDNLAEHDSLEAEGLRTRIETMVRDGQTDDQIKATLIAQYGERILTLPEGTKRTWLFITPAVAGALGLAAIAFWLRRARALPAAPGLPPADLEPGWDQD